jgi:16S rRNA (adenine1518-N6/adenine1519-N6)-dimethyltransferase
VNEGERSHGAAHGRRQPLAQWRADLEARGFRPSKRLGQNFLVDENMARAIARDARVSAGDFVLEVGPGCGFLSVHLAALGVRLVAIEIDPRLCELAREVLSSCPQTRVLQGDALDGKHALNPELLAQLPPRGIWHVVSNLPYSAGTPILVLLSRTANPPQSMTVLVQRELAERIAAGPGSKTWGPVTVRLQASYAVEIVRHVPPRLFWPEPDVESSLLRLSLRERRPSAAELDELDALVDGLFQHRRKTLQRLLGELLGARDAAKNLLEQRGLEPSARPESLSLEDLLALARSDAWRARPR